MTIYIISSALCLVLLTMSAGTALLIYANQSSSCCSGFAKIISYVVVILSFMLLVCMSYNTMKAWEHGAFKGGNRMEMRKHDRSRGEGMKMRQRMQGDSEGRRAEGRRGEGRRGEGRRGDDRKPRFNRERNN